MSWPACLQLDYRLESARTVVRHQYSGPLRILKSLYPEGNAICHNVLVHPPSGLVGGDTLDVRAQVASGAHALITTPGGTCFYRSTGELALQRPTPCWRRAPGWNGCRWKPLSTATARPKTA